VNQAPAGVDDDQFIIQYALKRDAFIVTNDLFKDYVANHRDKRHFIWDHRLSYSFMGDEVMLDPKIEKKLIGYLWLGG
jgi:hypothetical protein